jgi:hypothetical protein
MSPIGLRFLHSRVNLYSPTMNQHPDSRVLTYISIHTGFHWLLYILSCLLTKTLFQDTFCLFTINFPKCCRLFSVIRHFFCPIGRFIEPNRLCIIMSILMLRRFLSSLYRNHPVRLPFSAPVAIFTFAFTLLFIMTTSVVNGVVFDLTITGSNVVADTRYLRKGMIRAPLVQSGVDSPLCDVRTKSS